MKSFSYILSQNSIISLRFIIYLQLFSCIKWGKIKFTFFHLDGVFSLLWSAMSPLPLIKSALLHRYNVIINTMVCHLIWQQNISESIVPSKHEIWSSLLPSLFWDDRDALIIKIKQNVAFGSTHDTWKAVYL